MKTVVELKEAMASLPDDAQIIVEHGTDRYEIIRAFSIGVKTDDPGLVLQLVMLN